MASNPDTPAFAPAANGHDSRSHARILVTDDRPEMLRSIDRALGTAYECEFAANVEEARERLLGEEFKLAICDVNAAGELAMALAEEVLREHPGIAVVLLTGDDDPRVADRALALGVHGYLVEPLRPGQLLITVMNALRWRDLEIGKAAHTDNLWEQFQTIIDMAPIPVYAKDTSHRYVVANAKVEELAGLQRGETIGKTDEALMDPAAAKRAWRGDNSVLDGGDAFEVDETMHIGRAEKTFHTVKFPLLNQEGEITAVGGISVDITPQQDAIRLRDELGAAQEDAIEELRLSRAETVQRLVRAIERHDSSTGEHIVRIGRVAAFLADRLGLSPHRVELLLVAAPMHDVGKIGTPPEILRKRGPLTGEEREEMELHAAIGYEILSESQSELMRMAATIALTHHERYDGTGYPQRLAADEIPLVGRITAVADVFDALLSDRSYRPALPLPEVAELMREGRGTHFDPRVVDALLADLDECAAARG
ncbi:MAG: HD domain-containing phosphohydrolase [Solirubrobacterales bacterium]